jgi:hypothetical protein
MKASSDPEVDCSACVAVLMVAGQTVVFRFDSRYKKVCIKELRACRKDLEMGVCPCSSCW